jgi:acyl-coenzyme A synthetase/AMP-(fatty) acid ligase
LIRIALGFARPNRERGAWQAHSASLPDPSGIIWTDDLPKTCSGRITRNLPRDPDVMKQLV